MFANAFQGGKRDAESINPYVKQTDRLPGTHRSLRLSAKYLPEITIKC